MWSSWQILTVMKQFDYKIIINNYERNSKIIYAWTSSKNVLMEWRSFGENLIKLSWIPLWKIVLIWFGVACWLWKNGNCNLRAARYDFYERVQSIQYCVFICWVCTALLRKEMYSDVQVRRWLEPVCALTRGVPPWNALDMWIGSDLSRSPR